ncbi:hypothetical protein EB077_13305, partial [bacterium]|nr:hypothetical protein [bacterium]
MRPATTLGPVELQRLRNVTKATDPVLKAGFADLTKKARLDYKPGGLETVDIGPYGTGIGHQVWMDDTMQVWCHALMYVATQRTSHLDKALEITMDWVNKCKVFKGSNAPLEMAWGGTLLVRSICLLSTAVPRQVTTKFNKFLDDIVLPTLNERYNEIYKWKNNWILTIIECNIQICLYTNKTDSITKYVTDFQNTVAASVDPVTGLNTDSLRGDPYHFCFALGSQMQILEMLKHQ